MSKEEESSTLKRKPGRPKTDVESAVAQRLIDATRQLLQEHRYASVTEKMIAAAAGVNDHMIQYYFGDKEGLLFAVTSSLSDDLLIRLKALETIDIDDANITRRIFEIMVDAYYSSPWISRVAASEFLASTSNIPKSFFKRYGALGIGISHLQKMFYRLVKQGVYDQNLNVPQAALCMFSVITAPYLLSPISLGISGELRELKQDAWIDFAADMFDRKFRVNHIVDGIP